MTVAGQRFAICLAVALVAHAGLLAAMTGDGEPKKTGPADRTLSVTISTRTSTTPVDPPTAALAAQTGSDQTSRRARQGAAQPQARRAATPEQQLQREPNHGRVARFEMTADAATPVDTDTSSAAAAAAPSAQGAEQKTRSARADPRAAYLQRWKQHIERRGNRDFPADLVASAPEKRLTLGVTLMSNGRLHSVRVLRSSGSTPLDRAAQAIVRDASPFAAFPAALLADNPRLTFAYDWLFVADRDPAVRAARRD